MSRTDGQGKVDGVTAVYEARGAEEDRRWAQQALIALVLQDVEGSAAQAEIHGVARMVAQTGESPERLYGPARDWAEGVVQERRDEGAAIFADTSPTAREIVLLGIAHIAWLMLIVGVISALSGTWWVEVTAVAPVLLVLLGMAPVMLYWGWETLRRRRGQAVAVMVTAAGTALAALGGAGLFAVHHELSGPRVAVWAWCLAAAAPAWLSWALGRAWPVSGDDAADEGVGADPSDADARWLRQARDALRARGDLTESRIAEILAEVQQHRRETEAEDIASGDSSPTRTLRGEFGDPRAYARALPGDPQIRARNSLLFWMMVTVLLGVDLTLRLAAPDGDLMSWGTLALGVLWLLVILRAVMAGVELVRPDR